MVNMEAFAEFLFMYVSTASIVHGMLLKCAVEIRLQE